MRRLSLLILAPAFCAVWLSGCGATPLTPAILRKPWFDRDMAKADPVPENPLRKRRDARPTERNPADDRSEGEQILAARPDDARGETSELAKFDPELLAMIEKELLDTPPEERAQFYQDIVSLQPAMVRQIIQTRRIVRQVGQDAPSRFVTPDQTAGRNTGRIEHVGGEQFADESQDQIGRNPARDPGLGAVDPWDRETQSRENSAGGWTDGSATTPAPLPFNQIPAFPGTGHSAGYNSSSNPVQMDAKDFANRSLSTRPQIQPPPGGAQAPTNSQGQAVSVSPNTARQHRNARVPYDYNPLAPPVPNYDRGSDPFGGGSAPVRTASQNPNQRIAGAANGLGESFAPPGAQDPPAPNGHAGRNPAAWEADLNRLIASQEADVAGTRFTELSDSAQKTAYIQKHVYLRMLYLMAGQEARAVAAIPEIPAADQEFWQQTFWALSNYFDTDSMPDSDYRATQTIAQLRTAIQKLQENARLELRNVAFCHKISSFGNFDRFPQDEFGPGQPVLVYAEVSNFKSEPTTLPDKPNQMAYRTQLKSSIEIHRLGPSGELVERFEFEPTEDLCHNHRRDYFHSYEFTIPQRISLGPHVMTLTVEDQLSRKVATYRLNFMVK